MYVCIYVCIYVYVDFFTSWTLRVGSEGAIRRRKAGASGSDGKSISSGRIHLVTPRFGDVGFRGVGLRVPSQGFRVWFRVWGLGFKV